MLSKAELRVLRDAPMQITLVKANTPLIDAANALRRRGHVTTRVDDNPTPPCMHVMITESGADAYARAVVR